MTVSTRILVVFQLFMITLKVAFLYPIVRLKLFYTRSKEKTMVNMKKCWGTRSTKLLNALNRENMRTLKHNSYHERPALKRYLFEICACNKFSRCSSCSSSTLSLFHSNLRKNSRRNHHQITQLYQLKSQLSMVGIIR